MLFRISHGSASLCFYCIWHFVVMSRSARLQKVPTLVNPSLGNELSQSEGTSSVCLIDTGSVTSSNSGVLFEDEEPSNNLSAPLCIYPGGVNIQFWSWRFNNCAPTVFMVSMELVFEHYGLYRMMFLFSGVLWRRGATNRNQIRIFVLTHSTFFMNRWQANATPVVKYI